MFLSFMPDTKDDLTKRAFDSVKENDIDALRACLLEGFDLMTVRKTDATYYEKFLGMPDQIEDTVASLALKECLAYDTHWAFLRYLFDNYNPREILENPAAAFKKSVLLEGLLWEDLGDKTFESSDKHFCLWQVFRGNVDDMVSVARGSPLATGGLFNKANSVNLFLFFKNCIMLDEKNNLKKPPKAQQSM